MAKKSQAEFVKWFGPLLDALRDLGDSGRPREVSDRIAKNMNLSDQVLDETLKSGGSRFHNQVAWARQYMVWEDLLDSSKHGTWTLTEKGRTAHITETQAADIFKKWVAIHAEIRKQKKADESDHPQEVDTAPEELVPEEKLNLISTLRSLSPVGFEKVSRELLRESEGTPVSRAHVADFRNAMIGRAEKGIIITTSSFTNSAVKEANREGAPQVELVDGIKLVEMFERVELGVKKRTVFDVDPAYFEKFKT
jgi:restriction system protein